MNADELLRHYERIADAPEAVARLRRFVLDLAVRGKLVPQDPRDEPASGLLKKIATERAGLVSGRKANISAASSTFVNSISELPCPTGWSIASLQSICTSITDGDHLPPPKSEAGIPFLVIGNVRGQRIDFAGCRHVAREYYEKLDPIRRPRSGDLLYTLVGSYGIPVVVSDDRPFCVQRHIGILRPSKLLVPRFLARVLESQVAFNQATACATGIAQKTVSLSGLRRMAIPMPPVAEQHRIVAKVDELMALCDRLEAARAQREAARDRLARSCLARLDTPDPETFREDARVALDALPALSARPDQIKQLCQAILNLAVRGKLSDHSDWATNPTRLGNVASLQNGYAFKSEWFSTSGIRLVRNANVSHGALDWSEQVRLPESRADEYERFRLHVGDVVLSLDRPFIVTGTKVARVSRGDLPALLLQRVGRFVLSDDLHPDYLYLWIKSPHFAEQIDPGRSNGVPHISSKQVENAAIFVPPLAEQRHIVAKVNELMALCDRLEASLTQADERRRSLLEALLHQALQPAATLEEQAA